MAVFMVCCPGNMSPDASSPDQILRNITGGLFGLLTPYGVPSDPQSGVLSDLTVRNGREGPGGICARSGNWFPQERLTRDGQGRLVGDIFRTDGPAVIPDEPFPVFFT